MKKMYIIMVLTMALLLSFSAPITKSDCNCYQAATREECANCIKRCIAALKACHRSCYIRYAPGRKRTICVLDCNILSTRCAQYCRDTVCEDYID